MALIRNLGQRAALRFRTIEARSQCSQPWRLQFMDVRDMFRRKFAARYACGRVRSEQIPITHTPIVLNDSKSGCLRWRARAQNARVRNNAGLSAPIISRHAETRRAYRPFSLSSVLVAQRLRVSHIQMRRSPRRRRAGEREPQAVSLADRFGPQESKNADHIAAALRRPVSRRRLSRRYCLRTCHRRRAATAPRIEPAPTTRDGQIDVRPYARHARL
jgi:hypothetical protein